MSLRRRGCRARVGTSGVRPSGKYATAGGGRFWRYGGKLAAVDARMPQREVLFEGFREEEILNLPKETVEQLILLGEPLVFRVGSAVLLGSFNIHLNRLVVELAQIEGG